MPRLIPHLNLDVSFTTGKQYAPFVSQYLRSAFALLRPPLRELTIVFVGDEKMTALHGQFLNLYHPTDVLTFPIDQDSWGRVSSGEVYICIPEARRQARQRGTAIANEVLLYSLHGMLHLCGFDDRTEAEYRKMHRMEDKLLLQLGIGRVFSPTAVPRKISR